MELFRDILDIIKNIFLKEVPITDITPEAIPIKTPG